jgi:DNA-binding response OmpR family regulator
MALQPKAVLVVDDDAAFASVVGDALATEGYQVATATSGQAALDLVRDRRFGLILIDVRMPELDGPGFFRELQSRDPEHASRVMFMTGAAVGPDTAEFLFSLRAPCLRKPIPIDELRAAVKRFFLGQSFTGFRRPGDRS